MSKGANYQPEIGIVIPFFQRKTGVLTRALQSIENQTEFFRVKEIVVVDDGSPTPAATEIESLPDHLRDIVTLIEQKNQGVSAARNRGIEHLVGNCSFLAFLDSDDVWLERHVEEMALAFEDGAQFYFCNHLQLGADRGAFERADRLKKTEHHHISGGIYKYQGDMVNQVLTANVIGTSTVGYRLSDFNEVRFNELFKFAGEDYLFWFDLSRCDPTICFSMNVNVHYHEGVNIFAGAKWGTMHLQHRMVDEIRFKKYLLSAYELTERQSQSLKRQVKDTKRMYYQNLLGLLKRGRFDALGTLWKL